MEKKNEKITGRDVDFAQWYTDVCKKAEHCYETTDVKFFDPNHLPRLSFKGTKHEVLKMIKAAKSNKVIFD